MGVKRPWLVLLTFMALAWVLSMFCSNTATTVMLVPFATGILDTTKLQVAAQMASTAKARDGLPGKDGSRRLGDLHRFSLAVLLGICYSALAFS